MKILILGIDGFVGWTLALHLANKGHKVSGVDNFNRRKWVKSMQSQSVTPILPMKDRINAFFKRFGYRLNFYHINVINPLLLGNIFSKEKPDCIVHFAEQPSAAYSMKDVKSCLETYKNNILGTLSVLWNVKKYCPKAHILHAGTMGVYSYDLPFTPEGNFEIEIDNKKLTIPYPKLGGSFYHCTKSCDAINLEFGSKVWNLKITDVHQGIIYGIHSEGMDNDNLLTRLDIDECFVPGTRITCNNGYKNIEEICIGDEVLTHKNRYCKVTKVFSRKYQGTLLKLEFDNKFNNLICTPSHPFLAVERTDINGFSEPKWMTASEIKSKFEEIKHYEKNVKYWFEETCKLRNKYKWGAIKIAKKLGLRPTLVESWIKYNNFSKTIKERYRIYLVYPIIGITKDIDEIDCRKYNKWKESKYNKNHILKSPLPSYLKVDYDLMKFFGLWLAEGSITSRGISFSFNQNKDKKLIEFTKKYSENVLKINYHILERKNCIVITLYSIALKRLMLDLFNCGAKEKEIPQWILFLPIDKQQGLIDGIFAGDGYKGNNLEIANLQLCESIRLILGRMGKHASIYKRSRTNIKLPEGRTCEESIFYNCHWNDLSKDKTNYKFVQDMILVPIRNVEEISYDGMVYNLHVEKDNSYVANTVAVHNCFGTLAHRFVAQAVSGMPLTLYGKGHQRRGFIPLSDAIQCFTLLLENPPKRGYRVVNQFENVYDISHIADKVIQIANEFGINAQKSNIPNPRVELEDNYWYDPIHKELKKLGYKPSTTLENEIRHLFKVIVKFKHRIKKKVLMPRIDWR